VSSTSDLIELLARQAAPVRRLRPPAQRAGAWILVAAAILLLFTALHGVRPDLLERLRQPDFALGMAGALLSGVLAAVAAFQLSLPDRSALWLWLPAPAIVLWAATIGYGCLANWVVLPADAVTVATLTRCLATLVLTSLPLSLILLVMLRHAAAIRPTQVAVCGGLAVSGIAATALSVFHEIDATVMVLVWNVGTAVLIVLVGGAFGRRLFALVAPRRVFDER
jgi:hypothetical protein